MKISATIQARTASSRLPNKVLKKILDKPILQIQIERIKQSKLIDEIIIATTEKPADDPIEALAKKLGVHCFRGSEDDVLGRMVGALKTFNVELHVEFTGDNPFADPQIIDEVIDFYLKNNDKYDYVSNCMKTTYPPGMGVSVYPAKILYDAEKYVPKENKLREHVTIHIFQHPDRYRTHNIEAPPEHNYPDLFLEVDTKEDFEVMSEIYKSLYPKNPYFSLAQIIEFMSNNEKLSEKNRNVHRRWKEFRLG